MEYMENNVPCQITFDTKRWKTLEPHALLATTMPQHLSRNPIVHYRTMFRIFALISPPADRVSAIPLRTVKRTVLPAAKRQLPTNG
jgi:hypothetical protein